MNTRRNAERRLKEDIVNVGVPPRDDQVQPFMEDVNDDQALLNTPPLTDENIRAAFFQIAWVNTTQAQAATTQAQAMKSQADQEVVPREHQQVATMSSRKRDFMRMNPTSFYFSMIEENPESYLIKFKRSSILWGCLLVRRSSYPCINLRMWLKDGMYNGEKIGR